MQRHDRCSGCRQLESGVECLVTGRRSCATEQDHTRVSRSRDLDPLEVVIERAVVHDEAAAVPMMLAQVLRGAAHRGQDPVAVDR